MSTEDARHEEPTEEMDQATLLARLETMIEAPLEGTFDVAQGLLAHACPRVRQKAARALAATGSPRATEPLKALLSPHEEREVRTEGLRSLIAIGGKAATKVLKAVLENEDDPAHTSLLEVLVHREGPRGLVPTLRKILFTARYPFKQRVLEALARYRGPRVEAIFQEYLDETDEDLASRAAAGLANFPTPENYRRLTARLARGPWTVQIACLDAMFAIEPRPAPRDLAPALESEHPEVVLRGLDVLARRMGSEALPMVRGLVRATSWKIRERVAAILGRTGDPRVKLDLERLSGDERAAVRAAAFANSTGVPGVAHEQWGERAARDREAQVRRTAPGHLAEVRSLTARTRLLALLEDADGDVRLAALRALQGFELIGLADHVKPLARDPIPEVKALARDTLSRIGEPADRIHLERALELVDAGEHAEAQAVLRRLAVDRPTDPAVLYELAKVCRRLDDPGEAEVYLRKVVEERPEHVGARKHLAEVLLELGRRAEAAGQLKEACAGDPGNWKLWASYGDLLLEQGMNRAAVGAYEEALGIHHGHRPSHRGLARAYERAGDREGALREWTYLHGKDAGDAAPLAEMGRLALELGRHEEAASWLSRARDLGHDTPELLDHLADALGELGSEDGALLAREQAVAAAGGGRDRRLKLARQYLQRNDAARALAVARALRESEGHASAEVLDLEAEALADLGELEAALDRRIELLGRDEEFPGARLGYARLLRRMGRNDQARDEFEQYLAGDPLDRQALKELVAVEVGAGRLVSALRHLERGMEIHALDADLRHEAAVLHRRRGETLHALQRAREAAELRPEHASYRVLLGDLHRENGSPSLARQEYQRAVDAGLEDPRVRFLVGRTLLEENEPAKALGHLTRAESGEFAENPDLHLYLGECHLRLGRPSRARPYLARAASMGDDPRAYRHLAHLELDHGDVRDALGHVRTLARLEPDAPDLALLEGRCHRRLGEVGIALERFKKALAHSPGEPGLVAELAACYLETGRHREITQLFPGSPVLPSEEPAIRVAKGTAHLALGNHAKAATLAREMIELDEDLLAARVLLVRALRAGGDLAGAETAANRGLAIAPDDGDLLEERAQVHLAKRYFDAALADAHRGLAADPGRAALYLVQGQAHQGLGRYEQALPQLSAYLLRAPRDPAGHLALARCLDSLKRREEACEAYRNSLALDGSQEEVYLRLAELEIELCQAPAAAATLRSFLEVTGERSPALAKLAALHEAQGELDQAAECLDELVRVQDGEEARMKLLELHLRRRDLTRVWPLLERSATLYPEIPRRLGEMVLDRGDPALAKDLLTFSMQVSPRDTETLHLLAICQYRLGSYDAAHRVLERLLDRLPLHAGGHFYMGLIQLIKKAPDAAREHFERAVEGDPENLVAHRHLASLCLGAGRFEEAKGWARAGLQKDRADRELLLVLAAALERLEDDGAAATAYEAAGNLHVDARSHLPAIRIALRTGQAARARDLGEHYVIARPEDATGKRLLARAAAADGDPARAAEVLETLRQDEAANPNDLRTLARAHAATERWDQAAKVAEEVLAGTPEDSDTWQLLGHVETQRGRFGEASRAFEESARRRPQWADAWRSLASSLLEQSRFREAEEPAETAARLQASDPRNQMVWGQVLYALGRTHRSREVLERALRLAGKGELAGAIKLHLARVLRDLGEPGNAKSVLRTVPKTSGREAARQILEIAFEAEDYPAACHHAKDFLARFPEEPGVLEILGRSLVQMGMHARARSCFDRHMTLFGTPVGLTADLARSRLAKGQASDAVQLLVQGLEKASREPSLWAAMAEARAAKGDHSGSLTALERAFDLAPGDHALGARLGHRYLENRDFDKARALYRTVLEARPYDATLLVGLGQALAGQGESSEALKCFQKAVEAEPRNGAAQRHLGLALARQGHRPRAVEALRKAVRLDEDDLVSLHALARAYRDLGREEDARTWFERLAEKAPPRSPEAKAARSWLHERKAA